MKCARKSFVQARPRITMWSWFIRWVSDGHCPSNFGSNGRLSNGTFPPTWWHQVTSLIRFGSSPILFKSASILLWFPPQNAGRYSCEFCEKTFQGKCGLAVHRRIHTGEMPFVCKQCPKKFNNRGNFKRHVLDCHSVCILNAVGQCCLKVFKLSRFLN